METIRTSAFTWNPLNKMNIGVMQSILITGASGFIGSFIVEEALQRGMTVWAGIRSSSSRRYLKHPGIRFIELDFARPDILKTALESHRKEHGRFDYIVHCAGVTKCTDKHDFERVNFMQTRCFVDTLRSLDMVPQRFLFVSTERLRCHSRRGLCPYPRAGHTVSQHSVWQKQAEGRALSAKPQ